MIVFGLAEILTSFRHEFLGMIRVSSASTFTYAGASMGLLYATSGVLLFTMRKWAASVAVVFLVIVVFGRVALVVSGLYPVDSFLQVIAIVIGTCIAAAFAIYIILRFQQFK